MARMRTTALLFGLIGGVLGLVPALLAMEAGASIAALDGRTGAGAGGVIAGVLSVVGIVGGALAKRSPDDSSILQLIAAIGGFLAISGFWIVSGTLFVLGALFAFLARRSERTRA